MTHRDLIDRWPSLAQFGRDADIHYESVRAYHRTGSIPYWHWASVVKASHEHGFDDVSVESLAEGAAAAKRARAEA